MDYHRITFMKCVVIFTVTFFCEGYYLPLLYSLLYKIVEVRQSVKIIETLVRLFFLKESDLGKANPSFFLLKGIISSLSLPFIVGY